MTKRSKTILQYGEFTVIKSWLRDFFVFCFLQPRKYLHRTTTIPLCHRTQTNKVIEVFSNRLCRYNRGTKPTQTICWIFSSRIQYKELSESNTDKSAFYIIPRYYDVIFPSSQCVSIEILEMQVFPTEKTTKRKGVQISNTQEVKFLPTNFLM